MAIYIRIIGLRKFESIEREKKRISTILDSIELDLKFLNFIPVNDKLLTWELSETEFCKFYELKIFDCSIKLVFDNSNFIEFYCSKGLDIRDFGVTEENKKFVEGVRKIFGKIATGYGIKELIYFSEWFFDPDSIREGVSTFEELKQLIDSNKYIEQPDYWGKWKNDYFIEKVWCKNLEDCAN